MKATNYYRSLEHGDIMESIKSASSAEAKVDALADLVYKIIINDLHCLEQRVAKNEAFRWQIGGIVAAATAAVQILIKILVK